MRRYLWSSWRRFWNPDATLLVEKTSGFGGNMRRARWLAALFAPARSVKVVSVVKNPLVNAQFDAMSDRVLLAGFLPYRARRRLARRRSQSGTRTRASSPV